MNEVFASLGWAGTIVNLVRGALGTIGVPLPAFLGQFLALGVFVGVALVFLQLALKCRRNLVSCLLLWIVTGGAAIAALSVVVYWVDYVLWPRSMQIVGRVDNLGARTLIVDLEDYQGDSLVPVLEEPDQEGAFYLNYEPSFGDPPKTLVFRCGDSKRREIKLRRPYLLGEELSITCDAP